MWLHSVAKYQIVWDVITHSVACGNHWSAHS